MACNLLKPGESSRLDLKKTALNWWEVSALRHRNTAAVNLRVTVLHLLRHATQRRKNNFWINCSEEFRDADRNGRCVSDSGMEPHNNYSVLVLECQADKKQRAEVLSDLRSNYCSFKISFLGSGCRQHC